MPTRPMPDAAVEAMLRAMLEGRAPRSLCPSEVARALADDDAGWRALMPVVRAVAVRLAGAGELTITRRGQQLAPDAINGGPIRLTRGPPREVEDKGHVLPARAMP